MAAKLLTALFVAGCAIFSAVAEPLFRGTEFDLSNEQVRPITLDEAIEMALTNNLDAEIDRVGLRIANERIHYGWGAFDPVLSTSVARDSQETPQNATN